MELYTFLVFHFCSVVWPFGSGVSHVHRYWVQYLGCPRLPYTLLSQVACDRGKRPRSDESTVRTKKVSSRDRNGFVVRR